MTAGSSPRLVRRIGSLPRAAWVICAGMFLIKVGNFLNVFLVLYLTASGYGPGVAGIALGLVSLGNLVGSLLGGAVADRFGRRTAIVGSMIGYGFLVLFVPFAANIVVTLVLVSLIGLFAQLYRPAAGAALVDVLPPEQRVFGFAVARVAINVGMAIGPALGGFVSGYSFAPLFFVEGAAAMAFGLLAWLTLRDTRPVTSGTDQPVGYRTVLADRGYLFFLAAMVAATFVYSQAISTLPLHVIDAGFSNTFYGLLLSTNAFVIICFELPFTRWTERRPAQWVIATGLVLLGVGFGLTGVAASEAMLVGTVLVWTVAEMIYTPVAAAYPGQVAPVALRGRYQGAEALAHTLGATLGPAAGGLLYGVSPARHWLMCLAVGLAGAGLVLRARRGPGDRPAAKPG